MLQDKAAKFLKDEKGRQAATSRGLLKAGALVEKHHKTKEMIGGRLGGKPPHPTKLTHRTRALSRSYTRKLILGGRALRYGSDLEYAAVHEYGNLAMGIPVRPGVETTMLKTADDVARIMADEYSKWSK